MSTILDKFKSDVPIITDNFKNLARRSKTLDIEPDSWEAWAKAFDKTDKEALKFFADVDSGKRNIKDIDSYMINASSATSAFGDTLKNVATNMAIMIIANVAIDLLDKVADALIVTKKIPYRIH